MSEEEVNAMALLRAKIIDLEKDAINQLHLIAIDATWFKTPEARLEHIRGILNHLKSSKESLLKNHERRFPK